MPQILRQLEAVVRFETRILARILITRGRYMLGQERKNEIFADHESISAKHARLTVVSEEEIYIEDVGSANGTYVNGKPVVEKTQLHLDSKIIIGDCSFEFQRLGLPASIFQYVTEGFLRRNRYTRGELSTEGRTSNIYEVRDASLNRSVAFKVMRPQSQTYLPHVLRFIREAQIAAQLQHPAILPVYELNINEESELYCTTRFVENDTLADILYRLQEGDAVTGERYTLCALVNLFQKICEGIAFAHSKGVVHGALQPETITSGEYGEVFILGWSTATLLRAPASPDGAEKATYVTAPSVSAAPTLSPYSAPIQASGDLDKVTQQVDIYALGCILYKIISLKDPISATDEVDLVHQIAAAQHIPLSTFAKSQLSHWPAGNFPEPLAQIAMNSMSSSAADRPDSVQTLRRRISLWQESLAANGEASKQRKGLGGLWGRH